MGRNHASTWCSRIQRFHVVGAFAAALPLLRDMQGKTRFGPARSGNAVVVMDPVALSKRLHARRTCS